MRQRPDNSRDSPLFWEPSLLFLQFAMAFALVGSAAALIIFTVFLQGQEVRAIGSAAMLLVTVAVMFLYFRGSVRAAVNVLAVGMWTTVTVAAYFTGGAYSTITICYPLIILLLGWFSGERATVAATLLTVATVLGFALGESWGWLPLPPPVPPIFRWFVQSFVFGISAMLVISLVRSYQSRLAALRNLGDELNRAQAVAQVGSWTYDIGANVMRLSAEASRIFGIPEGTACRLDVCLERFHPEDRKRMEEALRGACKGGVQSDDEYRIAAGDTTRWIRQKVRPGSDAATGCVGTAQDITARKRQEDLIREHNAQLTRQKAELQATLGRVKRLEGMLAICTQCKKIRAGDDNWQQLEKYIGAHSDAVFSHGICPECLAKAMKKLD
jgi:PAS domain-containing protein